MADIESNREIVADAESALKNKAYAGGAESVAGRQGIISQLKEACSQMVVKGEFTTTVFYLAFNSSPTEAGRVSFQIMKAPILFNSSGDFEQNLVKYGIN